MAPKTTPSESSSLPLADHFFIAGIESSQVYDERTAAVPSPPPVEDTIDENEVLDTVTNHSPRPGTPGSLRDGEKRGSRYSFEARKSQGSIIGNSDITGSDSNRSSTTIKGVQVGGSGLSDEDFEQALRKFASERDSFLEEIHFTAGAPIQQSKSKPRPKTVRITNPEELGSPSSGIRGGVGSSRRRLSTMNSLKRQPSRQSSVRTAKRSSGYNSVIPNPQPFQSSPDMHPSKRRYEPVLLDRYPTSAMVEESKRRCPFPDYVPMFAFPNDVSVVSSDERPNSTWHGFAMTNSDGSKSQGICITVWLPLNQVASDELERQCEAWRKANMSDEERESASSLGERLAGERAKLSRLLAKLPTVTSDTEEREELTDEISATEEKIGLMTDLLRPVRHGAASKIDGSTDGETGFWIPRVYGILGRDADCSSFWKEWLKAVVVPMTNGGISRVPSSSPKIGMWQPLERYVVNLCVEAPSPMSSITQVEIAIRELRLYARKEALNELPGSRNTDLYASFRASSVPNIVTSFEYVLSESRIIFLSSHTAMLHLATAAITSSLYPMKWAGVFIPVLPSRSIQALEAPCPYIIGVERRYETLEFPDDDFVLVDLDADVIESTGPPKCLPRQQRRKLTALLQAAAPHHNRFGVPTGPPAYAHESFPHDAFSSENPQVFNQKAIPSTLASLVSLNSASYGESALPSQQTQPAIYNAFIPTRNDNSRGDERPSTSSTGQRSSSSTQSPPSPTSPSPLSTTFSPSTPVSRNDSGYGLQTSLREKRSGHFDTISRRKSSVSHALQQARQPLQNITNAPSQIGYGSIAAMRRPSAPWAGHGHASSTSISAPNGAGSTYAPSIYAQSTLAASTIMPGVLMQPVKDTETTKWVEGHCMVWRPREKETICTLCDEKADDGIYRCNGCPVTAHARCIHNVSLVCPVAFRADQVRAAFVRCFASLFYTYRRFSQPASGERRKAGLVYHFNMDGFLRSLPGENAEYISMSQQTQAFNEFIHERESTRSDDPSIKLFDEIVLSKKNRGRTSIFSKSSTSFLSDTSDHLWRSAAAAPPNSRFPGDYRQIVSRIPAKLDATLMKEPRALQGAPRIPQQARTKRKPIPSMLGSSVSTTNE